MATATDYDPSMTVRDARARYFADNEFGADGGYSDAWVILAKLGPLKLGIPNTAGRIRAVQRHDLHHLATGYDTDMLGESEISAWELGGGCKDFYAAWVLNLSALGLGVLRSPAKMRRAFVRGSRSQNLYAQAIDDSLLDEQLGALRARLASEVAASEVAASEEGTAAERRRYRAMAALGLGLNLALALTVLALLTTLALALRWWLG
jgi:hypothetical protein